MPLLNARLLQGVDQPRLQTEGGIRRKAQFLGYAVRDPESDTPHLGRQPIGILLHDRHCAVSIMAVNAVGIGGGDSVPLQEEHDMLDALLLGPALTDLLQFCRRYAGNLGKPLRLFIQDPQDLLSEGLHHALGDYRTHALQYAGGEIENQSLRAGGPFQLIAGELELVTILRMTHPLAHDLQGLIGLGFGEMTDDRHCVFIPGNLETGNGPAVIIIVVDDTGDPSIQGQFTLCHALQPEFRCALFIAHD